MTRLSFLLMLMAAGIAMGQTKHNHCISINGRVVSCAGINNVSNGWRCYLNDWPESCKETMAFWHKLDFRQVMGGCRADTDYEVICNESKPTAKPLPIPSNGGGVSLPTMSGTTQGLYLDTAGVWRRLDRAETARGVGDIGPPWSWVSPKIRPLFVSEPFLGGCVGRFGSGSTAIGGINGFLYLVSSRNLLSPLTDSHIPIERYREQGEPFDQEPYPVSSFCTLALGLALGLYSFWLMQYSDHFLLGLFLLLISLCVFVYGLNGIFDVMEINTH